MQIESENSSQIQTKSEVRTNENIQIADGTLIIMVGLPGSGKSTFANTHFPQEYIASADFERQTLTNNPTNQTVSDEAFKIINRLIESRLSHGKSVVVDAQNLDQNGRAALEDVALKLKRPVIAIHMDTDIEEVKRRDSQRIKSVGGDYLKPRINKYQDDLRDLARDSKISQIYRVSGDQNISVILPEEDRQLLHEDHEFYQACRVAETDLFAYVESRMQREKLAGPEINRFTVEPGSTTLLPENDLTKKFLANNVLPSQIVSLSWISERLHTEITDPSVKAFAEIILKTREGNNLLTFVTYPENHEQLAQPLIGNNPLRNASSISPEILANSLLEINDLTDNLPLLVLGDIHGCYSALRAHSNNVFRENLDSLNDEKRRMLFVGDIADRGPFSAEAIMYVTSLVRNREAVLVKGNHDENLSLGLREIITRAREALTNGDSWENWVTNFNVESLNEIVKSADTRETLGQLLLKNSEDAKVQVRLKLSSLEKIFEVFSTAPLYKNYRHLVAVHASLRRIPKSDDVLNSSSQKELTHGIRGYSSSWKGRPEVRSMHEVIAKDPTKIIVSGHTHRQEVEMRPLAGTINLDVDGGNKGLIYGIRWNGDGHQQVVSEQEPTLVHLFEQLNTGLLPRGEDLVRFVHYLETQDMVVMKSGNPGTPFADLIVLSYSPITELQSLWEKYPVLRNFRGLIIDKEGNIVARPFNKTHKAGVELPLEKLEITPDKVFEKANGSMGICYFWEGEWRIATKFSFDNDGYTKPASVMLQQMNTAVLKPENTYLFEIILPEDSHIVDYHGEKQLVLLNSRNKETGAEMSWDEVKQTAENLGCRTAMDLTEKFPGMTIAEIYKFAQKSGNLHNLEGLMAQYVDNTTGEKITVKVKTREYDDRKFVRDRMDWEKLLESYDWNFDHPGLSQQAMEKILSYNRDNDFAKMAIAVRNNWITSEYLNFVNDIQDTVIPAWEAADKEYQTQLTLGVETTKAKDLATNLAIQEIMKQFNSGTTKIVPAFQGTTIGFLKSILFSVPGSRESKEAYNKLSRSAQDHIRYLLEQETKKRGHSAYWLKPE